LHILIKNKHLIYDNYKVRCSIGKRGIGYKKKEGDLITPRGTYKVMQILCRKDRVHKIRSKFKIQAINKKMGWCNDPKSKDYNRLIYYPFKFSSEKLYRTDNIYDIILVLNYNYNPIIKGKGSAIFIHVCKKDFKPTEGCIAVKKGVLRNLLKKIYKGTKVKII
tara:strand:+ start:1050 stop:1541 length:492 start_codon:yes stop_codon:yes gene_type:complete